MVEYPETEIDISWYKSIFQNALDSITITDLAGNILMANNPALSLFGYTIDELQQKNIRDLYENQDDRQVMLTKLKKEGMLKNYRASLVNKAGEVKDLSINHKAISNANGEIVAIHTSFMENSSISQAARSLKESEQRYRTLVEHAPEAITVLDVETMKFQDVNLKALELFKMSREELLNKSPVELSPIYLPNGERAETVAMEKIQEAANGGKPIFDWVHIDSENIHIPCQVQLIRLPHSEKILVRGSIIDMTEKIEAQRKLQESQMELAQSQKMEALGRLAGGVAHDFNNTLTAILGYCELLKLELEENDSLLEMVRQIENAGIKSTQLVNQLLTFSKKEELEKELVDVNEIIRETGNLLRHLIGEDIKIETSLDPEIGMVEAHPTQITQILMNLVINAREAMPKGGTLKIRTHNYDKIVESGELVRNVFLYVSDTGMGIDPDIIDQIFEPFFTTKSTGTGLGLSTVYGIVEQLNGDIHVDSVSNEGTTFQINFPISDQNLGDASGRSEKLDRSVLVGKSVIVIEDDDYVRTFVEQLLSAIGMDVTSSNSPDTALDLVRENSYDIIISDMIMPEMSGIELVTKIKEEEEMTRVLFITGYINQPHLHRVMEEGYPVLYKPFTRNNLLTMITRVILDNP